MKLVEAFAHESNWGAFSPPFPYAVLHGSGDAPGVPFENVLRHLQSIREHPWGYHFIIDKDGTIYQLTPENRIAFHAGKSSWTEDGHTYEGMNLYSVGIAFYNTNLPGDPITVEQLNAASELLKTRFPHILPDRVLTHKWVAPNRKSDPDNLTRDALDAVAEHRKIYTTLAVYPGGLVRRKPFVYSEDESKLNVRFLGDELI